MLYLKNKQLYVTSDTGESYQPLYTVDNQIILTADLCDSGFSLSEYRLALHSPLTKRFVQVFQLNEDETIRRDISQYVQSYNVSYQYDSGKIRSGSMTLMNFHNEFFPNPVNGSIWKGTKIYIKTGIYYNGTAYIRNCGIFILSQPKLDESNGTISVNLYDKFAMLDGTIGGKRDSSFSISRDTPIKDAIQACLSLDKGNGKPYDTKPLIFPPEYATQKTPYDMMSNPNITMGELIIELAEMITCDVFYDDNGNLNISKGIVVNDDLLTRPVLWNYTEDDYSQTSINMDIRYDDCVNYVRVEGAVGNGYLYHAIAENKNPKSPTNIYLTEPNLLQVSDGNLLSDELCLTRAKYELIKQGRLTMDLTFTSIFIPHLDINKLIWWHNKKFKFLNQLFVVNSFSFSDTMFMDLNVSNVEELSI